MNPANKWLIGALPAALISGAALWEGTKYYAYKDIVGVPTVCSGYTGKDIVFGKKYSPQECAAYLATELKEHSTGILKCINVPINQNEYIAYSLFAYNVGVTGACKSTSISLLNKNKRIEACNALLNWSYAGGVWVRGLNNRRQYEAAICKKEPYVL